MEWIQNAIREGEAELKSLDTKRSDVVKAIASLRALVAPPRPSPRPRPSAKATARSRPDEPEVGAQENGRRQKILAALKDGPLATRDIAKAIGVDKKLTKMALQRMKKVGLVGAVGVRAGSKWTRPGTSPARREP